MNDFQAKYLGEVGQRLRRVGFTVRPEYADQLSVEKDACQFCHITMQGSMSYDADFVWGNGLEDALDQVREIAVETMAYMQQMAAAPPLLVDDLSGDYRLLAEFNHIVLAGHERRGGYGVEFITWERIRDGTGLWQGHYCDNNYAAAKQDFAVRSGLLPSCLLFTQEQLAVIFDAAQNMGVQGLVSSPEQEKLLEEIMGQIEEAVPRVIDLANELTRSPERHEPGGMQLY